MIRALIDIIAGPVGVLIGSMIAVVITWITASKNGARKEREKQLRADARARDAADEIERSVAGRTEEEQRSKLWTRN